VRSARANASHDAKNDRQSRMGLPVVGPAVA
jgi:hypothetical protein